MTYHVVRRAGDEKGAAFEDEDVALGKRDTWAERHDEEYEVVERDKPLDGELAAAAAASVWDDLAESMGLL